jgi:DNA-binding MarR family transcriptional regulator
MSLTVDRLERGGYVRRARSTEDRRRVDLRLTPAGLRIKQQQKVLEPELISAMLRRLGDRPRAQALKGLELLASAAQDVIASGDLNRFLRGGTV